MKAAEFDYFRVKSLEEACQLLADAGPEDERKIIAGGQTLVPLMAMRFARPTHLIDIADVAELAGIDVQGETVVVGAMTRQRDVERSSEIAAALPLLTKAVNWVGHQQTRNRGTVGGSIAHGDPSAEIPLTAAMLEATLIARSATGSRDIPIDGFFEGAMITAIEPEEILTEIHFPVWQDAGTLGTAFHEVSSRQSDFAVVSAAAQIVRGGDGACVRAAVGVGGCAPGPVKLRAAEEILTGTALDETAIEQALDTIDAAIEPDSDLHGTADYRRRVARVLVGRAIRDAAADALQEKAA